MAVFYRQDIGKSPENEISFVGRLFKKAKELPESVPQAIRQELATLSAELNGGNEELKTAKKEDAENLLSKLKEKARDGLQKYVREGKTAELKNRADKKYEKLLSHAKSFDDVRAGDVLRMRASGENIAKYLLTDEEGDEINLDSSTIEQYKNKKLLVNFGNNKSIDASIGLGDILPYEAKVVKITKPNGETVIGELGYKDSRKGRQERVGYYDTEGKYIAVYNGYKISIMETYSKSSDQEKEKFEALKRDLDSVQNNHLTQLRIKEMTEVCIAKNGYKKTSLEEVRSILSSEFPDEADQNLFEKVSNQISDRIARGEHIRDAYKDGIGSRDKFVGKFGWYFRDVIAKDFPNIPAYMLVNLFDKESDPRGKFDPGAYNSSGAYGLGQMQSAAWADAEKHANMSYDRSSPYDQIHASAAYLDMIIRKNNCDIKDAIVYYHMGPNVLERHIKPNNLEMLESYKKSNPAITKEMKEDSWKGYMDAARYYYTEESTLLKGLDLSGAGTELATQLGDFVMSTMLPNTGDSSCGMAVGELLSRFGIEGLPTSGRHGKNWDTILAPYVDKKLFEKVPIKFPKDAGAGAILVYNEGADAVKDGSLRDDFGHVEIVGSDKRYYYYNIPKTGGPANSPGGSAHAPQTGDPLEYQRLTGFTGYAYYPITKKS